MFVFGAYGGVGEAEELPQEVDGFGVQAAAFEAGDSGGEAAVPPGEAAGAPDEKEGEQGKQSRGRGGAIKPDGLDRRYYFHASPLPYFRIVLSGLVKKTQMQGVPEAATGSVHVVR